MRELERVAPKRWSHARFDFTHDRVNRDALMIFLSNAARLCIGLGSSILLARGLGAAGLGIFAGVGALGAILSTLLDFGLTNAGVSRLAQVWNGERTHAGATACALVLLKTISAGAAVSVALVLSIPFAPLLLNADNAASLLQLMLLGVLVRAVAGAFSAILQALRNFTPLIVSQLVNALSTLLLLAALYASARLDVSAAVGVGVLASVLALCAMLCWLSRSPLRAAAGSALSGEVRVLLRGAKWLWVSALFSILAVQLDLLVLNRMLAPALVGYYSLAVNLAFNADIVQQSLFAVLLPTASALQRGAYQAYVRDNIQRTLALALGLAVLVPLAQPLIVLLYGETFQPVLALFAWMTGIVIFDLLAMPLILLAFPTQQLHALALSDVVRVLTLLIGLWWLVPLGGLGGAVLAKFLSRAAGAGVTLFFVRRAITSA